MRIAIVGAQNVGKTTLINAFRQRWPDYSLPEKTYRELIKEKSLVINEQGSLESQKVIRDALADLALENAGKAKTIHDRCILDNLVYTFWLADYKKFEASESDINEFITTSIFLTKESLKFYDVIFWLPVNPNIPVVDGENRSTSEQYRAEIDNIFYAVYETYKKNSGVIFDRDNQPAYIVLEGDVNEKIETIKQYISDSGDLVETTNSVLAGLEDLYDEAALLRQIGG